jgi:hypothetical protein
MRALTLLLLAGALGAADWRNIQNGSQIPNEKYADQPYVVITPDRAWLCVLTTGKGVEGQPGQHIISTISRDKGRTWSTPVDIEPADGPEASWAMPLLAPSGRVYVFYTYNKQNLRRVPGEMAERTALRVDTLGVYAFKYSDDNGRTWSKERYEIPLRSTRIDRENNTRGATQFFWGVGKPVVNRGAVLMGFAKVGRWGEPGAQVETQNFLLRSPNLLAERDPKRIRWEMFPEGDEGLHGPKGRISDEFNPVAMNDGSVYATFRTLDGFLCHTYSRDNGRTWTTPEFGVYEPGGRRIKHPRAANFVKKFSNGKYLLWFHNAWGDSIHLSKYSASANRNPAWIAGGVERNGAIHWSEPELFLYDPAGRGVSYPDFIEDGGRFFVTETQKSIARVHEIDRRLLEAVWSQAERKERAKEGLALDTSGAKAGAEIAMPRLPDLAAGGGFALDFWVRFAELTPGQVLLDTRDEAGRGVALAVSERNTLELTMADGKRKSSWDSDPGVHAGTLRMHAWHHVTVNVDGAPKVVSFVVDGTFNDGGPVRVTGWGWFDKALGDVNGKPRAALAPSLRGELRGFRVYDRYLLTSEAVAAWRAGLPPR